MDYPLIHANERLTKAVRELATSPKSIARRLDEVYWHQIHGLHENELPPDAQRDLTELKSKLQQGQALTLDHPDGTGEAVALAQAVWDLHMKVRLLIEEAQERESRGGAQTVS